MTAASLAVPPRRGATIRAGLVGVPLLLLLGGLSARLSGSTDSNPWYQTLVLPELQPPPAAFGIAWSILYTLLAVAAARVWGRHGAPGRTLALLLFAAGIAVNLLWSPAFFRYHLILPALAIILAMLALAIATAFAFARVDRLAAWLLLPYLCWLGFAAALNARIWTLNPTADAFQLEI